MLIDTTILLNLLDTPFESDEAEDVQRELDRRASSGVELRVPVAALVEAGDHVGRILDGTRRRRSAERLKTLIDATLDGDAPWGFAPLNWDDTLLRDAISSDSAELVDSLTNKHLEMGDLVILAELRRLRGNLDPRAVEVTLWTLDQKLAAAAST
ncbi:MAG: hypothetical protein AB7P00_14935 [Sandaracinaceae bacterium]